jgi:hypothetical protein
MSDVVDQGHGAGAGKSERKGRSGTTTGHKQGSLTDRVTTRRLTVLRAGEGEFPKACEEA